MHHTNFYISGLMIIGRTLLALIGWSSSITLSLLLLASNACIFSQANAQVEMTVTPDRRRQAEVRTAPIFELSADEIGKAHAVSLSDLLNKMAPLHIEHGPSGSYVHLRGAESNFVGVFVDGVLLNDPTDARGGAVDLDRIALVEVERIEILSAAEASLLGQGQLAGAINIITRRDKNSKTVASGTVGVRELKSVQLGTVNNFSDVTSNISVDAANDGQVVVGNNQQRINLNVGANYDISPYSSARAALRAGRVERRAFPEDSGGADYAENSERASRYQNEFSALVGGQSEITELVSFESQFSHLLIDISEDSPAVFPGLRDPFGIPATQSNSLFNRDVLQGQVRYKADSSTELRFIFNGQYESSSSDGSIEFGDQLLPADFKLSRYGLGYIAELHQSILPYFNGRFAVRYDQFRDYDNQIQPIVVLTEELMKAASIWVGYSEASKQPSIYALSHPIVGNENLKLERSRTVEVGLRIQSGDLRSSITFFNTDFYDVIDLDEGPPPMLVNRDKVQTYGSEVAITANILEELDCSVSSAFAYTNVENSDQSLRNRPRWKLGAGCNLAVENLSYGLMTRYAGSRHDSSVPTGDRVLSPYVQSDINVRYHLNSNSEIVAAIDNVFNDKHQDLVGVRNTGISPRISLEARF